jgi:2-oxoisovalerate dehydrogenase E1 component alpha subunit
VYQGIRETQFTNKPTLLMPEDYAPIPIYRVIDADGNVIDPSQEPDLSRDVLQKCFRDMVTINAFDKIMYESQRQGRISFYMTNFGEEASHMGSAAALSSEDVVYAQYREAGVLLWRGRTLEELIDQLYGNCDDDGKGKQMPVHYGSKKHNFVTISSTLSTQVPQAVGSAYALKRMPNNERVVVVYFGEGASSEGDVHAALNFAATLDCPVIFFVRNNGYAISTPAKEQYRGDGIASRATGYGMAAIRVDGTDLLAVYNATKIARDYCLKNNKPILFEAMQYRLGHHSTSDDSSAYRATEELEVWNTKEHPINKFKNYLIKKGWFNESEENDFVKNIRKKIMNQNQLSEKKLKPDWREIFYDVYDDLPLNLRKQLNEMEAHVKKYEKNYPLKSFKS